MYVLCKTSKKYKSDDILTLIGFNITLKKNKICLINPKLTDEIIKLKYSSSFEKLVAKILLFLDSNPDEDGAGYLLDELAREYAVFLNKYEKYLSLNEINKYTRKIRLLESELKLYSYKMVKTETKGRRL